MKKSRSKKRIILIILCVVALCFIATLVGLLILNTQGSNSNSIPTKENRIISLIPSVTQSIYYLEAQSKLVGCSNYCKVKVEDSLEIVGSVTKPNVEKIVNLRPDVLILSQLVSQKEVDTFRKFGIRVEIIPAPKSFDEICDQFLLIGKLVGKLEQADKIVSNAKKEVDVLDSISKKQKAKQSIFMQIGADPIYAVYPGTYMNDYISLSGNENIASDLTKGSVGREFVVSRNPDYIFVVTMGIIGEEEVKKWKQFSQLTAVKNNHIYILNSDIACQPTPFTFVETLQDINKLITKQ